MFPFLTYDGCVLMADYNNEVKIEDGENATSRELGIKEIALEQYRRCCVEGSKEMTRGGKSSRTINGKYCELDIPDQREVFFNSVTMLGVILSPQMEKRPVKTKVVEKNEAIKATRTKYLSEIKESKQKENYKYLEMMKDLMYSELMFNYKDLMEQLSFLLKDLKYFDEGGASS